MLRGTRRRLWRTIPPVLAALLLGSQWAGAVDPTETPTPTETGTPTPTETGTPTPTETGTPTITPTETPVTPTATGPTPTPPPTKTPVPTPTATATCAAYPTAFAKDRHECDGMGNLITYYSWQSSTGDPTDLEDVGMREHVDYLDNDDEWFMWPRPPWYVVQPDPTVVRVWIQTAEALPDIA
jgi:hypothetical protein